MEEFFKFILLVFLSTVIFIAVGVYVFYKRVRGFVNQFRQQAERKGTQSYTRTTHYGKGETVVDSRSPQETNRKIFTKDEGEYVDYEEEPKA